MSSFKLTGSIKKIGSVVQVTEKFKKLEFVVTDEDGMYPQHVTFQLTQDKCSMIDSLSVGQSVEVSFNVDGKEYADKVTGEMKYFNSLNAWRIEPEASAPRASAPPALKAPPASVVSPDKAVEDDDDLPF